MIQYLLLTNSINNIDFYIVSIKVHFHFYLVFYLRKEYINILKNVLFIKKLAFS